MASASTTTLDSALKEYYLPPAREQLNNENMMLAQIERTSRHVEGRRAVLSLHVQRNSGVGARAEGGALPTAGSQGYAEERVGLSYNYLRIRVSGQAMKATVNDSGSFVRALSSEMTQGVNDLRRDINRQIFTDGNAAIAQCASVSTATVTLTTPTTTQMNQLHVGMLIDIGTVSDADAKGAGLTISSIDKSAGTVTFSSNPTSGIGTSHFLFRQGNKLDADGSGADAADGAGTLELIGLAKIVGAAGTSLHNVDSSTYTSWSSTINSNSGTNRAATDTLFEKVIDDVDIESGKSPNLCVTTKGVRRNYAAQLKSMKRFNDGASLTLKGGFKALTIDCGDVSLPLVADRDCPANLAYLLNTSHLVQHEMSDWEWADYDGAVLRNRSGYDEWEAFMFKYHQLCTDQRNTHGKIADLSES
jgi:hypothetical protein